MDVGSVWRAESQVPHCSFPCGGPDSVPLPTASGLLSLHTGPLWVTWSRRVCGGPSARGVCLQACPCLVKGRVRFAFVSLMPAGISGGIRQWGWCFPHTSAMAMGGGQAALRHLLSSLRGTWGCRAHPWLETLHPMTPSLLHFEGKGVSHPSLVPGAMPPHHGLLGVEIAELGGG